jgi:predicted aspartyl protease
LAFLALLALAAGAAISTAGAANCSGPRSAELRVRILRDMPLVEVAIDGRRATLLLDTGAEDTVLTPGAAARLGLAGHYEYPRRIGALGGVIGSGVALTHHFAAGSLDVPDFRVMIGRVSLPDLEGVRPDGLLGADFLGQFAVDLELPDARLRLYRPACLADEPAWPPPFAAIAANRSLHDHLFFRVTLDGKPLYAFIDTGAQRSVVDRAAVLKGGVMPAALARAPTAMLRSAAAARVVAPLHRFARLEVGGSAIAAPVLSVAPLNLIDADLILGEDFIATRRIWLSYAPPQIFIRTP